MDSFLEEIYNYESNLPLKNRKEKGITYTPYFVVNYINERLLKNTVIDDKFRIIDISCGAGVFLVDLIFKIKNITNESFKHIIENTIYGIDYDNQAILLLQSILSRIVAEEGNTLDKANLFCGNSLNKAFLTKCLGNKKFKLIPGNPPYVRIQNIPDSDRVFVKNWKLISGNTDLYIPFYEAGISLLEPNGVLGYISSNTFLKNKSGTVLSKFLLENKLIYELIDFKDQQVFERLNTYTTICLLKNSRENKHYEYKEPGEDFVLRELSGFKSCYKKYPVHQNDIAILNEDVKIINTIESAGDKLIDIVNIKVGLATLADYIYFLPNCEENGEHVKFKSKKSEEVIVEKGILKRCIKVSVIKNTEDVLKTKDYIIFPYKLCEGKYVPMTEDDLRAFPLAHKYLFDHKEELLKRDKGKIDQDRWHLYGRTQGLNSLWGDKLLIPPLAQSPLFIRSQDEDLLYLSGYAIFKKSNTPYTLNVIKKILESNIMKMYINKKSKKMQDGWSVYSKEFMKNFSIPKLNNDEIKFILTADTQQVNDFLIKKYNLIEFNDTTIKENNTAMEQMPQN